MHAQKQSFLGLDTRDHDLEDVRQPLVEDIIYLLSREVSDWSILDIVVQRTATLGGFPSLFPPFLELAEAPRREDGPDPVTVWTIATRK